MGFSAKHLPGNTGTYKIKQYTATANIPGLLLNSEGGAVMSIASTETVPVAAQSGVIAVDNSGIFWRWDFVGGTPDSQSTHFEVLKSDGTLVRWGTVKGSRALASVTPASPAPYNEPIPVYDEALYMPPYTIRSNVIAIALGSTFGLELGSDGVPRVTYSISSPYGSYNDLSAGDYYGNFSSSSLQLPIVGASNTIAIAAGFNEGLALKADGTFYNWIGQRGTFLDYWHATNWSMYHTTAYQGLPSTYPVPTSPNFTSVAQGIWYALGLKPTGEVVGWGRAYDSANPYTSYAGAANVPTAAKSGVIAIAAGPYSAAALKSDGAIVRWGNSGGSAGLPGAISVSAFNSLSATGETEAGGYSSAVQIIGRYNYCRARKVQAFGDSSAVIKADGSLVIFGDNDYGQAVPPFGLSGVKDIAGGARATSSLVLRNDGSVVNWGDDFNLQSSNPLTTASRIKAVSASATHSMALKDDGSVISWGVGYTGVPSEASYGVKEIAAGDGFSIALKSNGTIVLWGTNSVGQLNATVSQNIKAIAAGAQHSLVLLADGSVEAWGISPYADFVHPSYIVLRNFTRPNNNIKAIAAGHDFSLLLTSNGEVLAAGTNIHGQLQVPVAAQSGVKAIAAGKNHCLALKDDGSVIAWGDRTKGQTYVPSCLQ